MRVLFPALKQASDPTNCAVSVLGTSIYQKVSIFCSPSLCEQDIKDIQTDPQYLKTLYHIFSCLSISLLLFLKTCLYFGYKQIFSQSLDFFLAKGKHFFFPLPSLQQYTTFIEFWQDVLAKFLLAMFAKLSFAQTSKKQHIAVSCLPCT